MARENPLLQALGIEGTRNNRGTIVKPRFITFKLSELGVDSVIPGQPFKATIEGRIKSIDDNQDVFASIIRVNGNVPLMQEERETSPMSVQTTDSPSP